MRVATSKSPGKSWEQGKPAVQYFTLQHREGCRTWLISLVTLHKKVLPSKYAPINQSLVSTTFFHYLKESHPVVCCALGTFINSLQLLCWKQQWAVHPNPVSLAWHDSTHLQYLLSAIAFAAEESQFALLLPARKLLHTSKPLPILKHFHLRGHPNYTQQ